MHWLNRTAKMAFFAPNSGLNDTTRQQYEQNIVKVTRQVITEDNERIDLVISVNGIPFATIELKNQMSATGWTVRHCPISQRTQSKRQII